MSVFLFWFYWVFQLPKISVVPPSHRQVETPAKHIDTRQAGHAKGVFGVLESLTSGHWFQFLKLLVALLALVNGLFELLALVYTSVRTKEQGPKARRGV
jgi:hypothetical protein